MKFLDRYLDKFLIGIMAVAVLLGVAVALEGAITLKKTNFAITTLDGGITNTATSMTVATGDGTLFPADGPFRAVLWGASYADPALDLNREIVNATLDSGDTFTVQRAFENTTAAAWSSGDNVALTWTAGVVAEIENEISAHTHDGRYYTETEMDAGQLDNRYYTEGEVDAALAFRGVLVTRTTAQAIPTGATTSMSFNSEDYDTDALHNGVSPERLTVPSGVSKVELGGTVVWATSATGYRLARLYKNGSIFNGSPYVGVDAGSSTTAHNLRSAVVSVSPGDYFTVEVYQNSGGNLDTLADLCWFWMRLVE